MVAMKNITESLLEIGQWVAILGTLFEKAPQPIKDKLPMFLGLSKEDERIWAELMTHLEDWERQVLTSFLTDYCEEHERNHFRYVVVGIPKEEVKEETGTGKDKKTKTTSVSRAVPFLKQIAQLMKDKGMREAYEQLCAGGTINNDPLTHKVVRRFSEGITWFRETCLTPFGIASLDELKNKAKTMLDSNSTDLDQGIDTFVSWSKRFYNSTKR